MRRELERFRERLEPFLDALGFGRQAEVLQDYRGFVPAQFSYCVLTILGRIHLVILKAPFELLEEARIVFDDKKSARVFCHFVVVGASEACDTQWCHEASVVCSRCFTPPDVDQCPSVVPNEHK